MTPQLALILILVLTIVNVAVAAPLGAIFREEMKKARAQQKSQGLLPLAFLTIVVSWTILGFWVYYGESTDQRLLWIIPAVAMVVGLIARGLMRLGKA